MFENTNELRKLIIENPDLPLVICAEHDGDAYGTYYKTLDIHTAEINEIALWHNGVWLTKEEYEDRLIDEFHEQYTYDRSELIANEKLAEIEFTKCIYVEAG